MKHNLLPRPFSKDFPLKFLERVKEVKDSLGKTEKCNFFPSATTWLGRDDNDCIKFTNEPRLISPLLSFFIIKTNKSTTALFKNRRFFLRQRTLQSCQTGE
jgi:hypothetical protein